MAYLRVANSQPKSANTSPDSHLECEVPTQQTAPTGTSAAWPKAEDAADDLGLAWGLLRVVQFKCKQPEACFSVRVTILGSGPSQLGKKVPPPSIPIMPNSGLIDCYISIVEDTVP